MAGKTETKAQPSPIQIDADGRLKLPIKYSGFEVYLNHESKEFEAEVNGEIVSKATLPALEKVLAKANDGIKAIAIGREARVVVIVSKNTEAGMYTTSGGNRISSKMTILAYDKALAPKIIAVEKKLDDLKEKYDKELEALLTEREALTENAPAFDATDVPEVRGEPGRGRKKNAESSTDTTAALNGAEPQESEAQDSEDEESDVLTPTVSH